MTEHVYVSMITESLMIVFWSYYNYRQFQRIQSARQIDKLHQDMVKPFLSSA